MISAKKAIQIAPELKPVQAEIKNLLTMFEFYLSQRQLRKSIETLGETVRDMRLIIGRLLIDHFLKLSLADGRSFCTALASMLADACEALSLEQPEDDDYCRYCIGEILTPFEFAMEIKEEFADDPVIQKMLSLDIPILRPFDYGLRKSFKVILPQKKRKLFS